MNNDLEVEFSELVQRFSKEWDGLVGSETLEQVEDAVTNVDSSRDEIMAWVMENIEDEAIQEEYFARFGEIEYSLEETIGGIPVFDVEFEVYDSFDQYEGYYQRYGCMTPEYVISWDGENILFADDYGTIEMIKRPDVLMSDAD